MLRRALFNIIRQEHRDIEDKLELEAKAPSPDERRVSTLRHQADSLQQELEHFPEARV